MKHFARTMAAALAVVSTSLAGVAHANTATFNEDDIIYVAGGVWAATVLSSATSWVPIFDDSTPESDRGDPDSAVGNWLTIYDGPYSTNVSMHLFSFNAEPGTATLDLDNSWVAFNDGSGPVSLSSIWPQGLDADSFGVASINLSITSGQLVYSLNPVPEPETYAMLLAGLGLVGAIARRQSLARR
jgi:hypothetical protein